MNRIMFFYGTLKRGCRLNYYLSKKSSFISNHLLSRYKMYNYVDWDYPVIYYSGDYKDRVYGEIWRVCNNDYLKIGSLEIGAGYREICREGLIFYVKDKVVVEKERKIIDMIPITIY